MKKFTQAVLVSLLMPLVLLAGCAGTEQGGIMPNNPWPIEEYTRELGTIPGLDAKTEWRILQDHYNFVIEKYLRPHMLPYLAFYSFSINDLYISSYYGTYNGYVVVTIADQFPWVFPRVPPRSYQIDGIVFPWLWPSSSIPRVWNNGQFYSIRDLFNSGLLTRDDLLSIARHNHPEDGE